MEASHGERFTIKQLERTKKNLEIRLQKLQANSRKDDVIAFEELGVDRMFVDESDLYKNLFLYTKMHNVAGSSMADAQKSSDMFAKCRYLDEITGGRGIVFATGMPISNSMKEMYSIQRYLQHDRLQEMDIGQLDFERDGFKIVYPSTPDDVIAEGHALHHCVGSYTERVAEKECIILFLRKCSDETKPFYTVEVRGQKAVQVQGKGNCDMTPEVEAFITVWEQRVLSTRHLAAAA